MRAIILAGGRGTRLAPFTVAVPKPLLPLGETPILEVVISQLSRAGFDHITLALGHLASYIKAFLDHRKSLARLAKIDFMEEEEPRGTSGSLVKVRGLTDSFLVMNGDILTTLDFTALMAAHREKGAALTIAMKAKPVKIDLGVIETDDCMRITDYVEKPTLTYHVSMGIYVYTPAVVELIEPDEYLDFPDLVKRLIRSGRTVQGYPTDAFWLDLGRREDFEEADEVFRTRRSEFLPE